MNICLGSESNANAEVLFHRVNGIPRKKTPNLTWSVTLLNLFPDEFVTITTFKCYYIQHDVFFIMLPLEQLTFDWRHNYISTKCHSVFCHSSSVVWKHKDGSSPTIFSPRLQNWISLDFHLVMSQWIHQSFIYSLCLRFPAVSQHQENSSAYISINVSKFPLSVSFWKCVI